jgi:hypothetical protein
MKLDISTSVSEDVQRQSWEQGYMTLESKYGWHCPLCGEYTEEFVMETFAHYRDIREYKTIITRTLTLHNDGEDWFCPGCRSPEARHKRLVLKKFGW